MSGVPDGPVARRGCIGSKEGFCCRSEGMVSKDEP
jgi:hypothetical protein